MVLFRTIAKGLVLHTGLQTLGAIYVTDVAHAAVCARSMPPVPSGSAYFLDDGEPRAWSARGCTAGSRRRLARTRFAHIHVPRVIMNAAATLSEARRARERYAWRSSRATRRHQRSVRQALGKFDTSSTRRDLGWAPRVPWQEGTRLTA